MTQNQHSGLAATIRRGMPVPHQLGNGTWEWSYPKLQEIEKALAALANLEGQLEAVGGMNASRVQRLEEMLMEEREKVGRLEEQLEARQKLIDRFLEWDALTALPEPLPAPFGDLHYWLSEFRRLASNPATSPEAGSRERDPSLEPISSPASDPASSPDVVCRCGGKEKGHVNFDRSICACGAMHYYCNDCGWQCEPCDEPAPAKERP